MNKNDISAVIDANIIIDFYFGGQALAFTKIANVVYMPELVFNEVHERHQYLEQNREKFIIYGHEFSNIQISNLNNECPLLSDADCAAFLTAQRLNSLLVTGDWALRNIARKHGIECRGTLWAIKKLVKDGNLTVIQAEEFYKKMKKAGRKIPFNIAILQIRAMRRFLLSHPCPHNV